MAFPLDKTTVSPDDERMWIFGVTTSGDLKERDLVTKDGLTGGVGLAVWFGDVSGWIYSQPGRRRGLRSSRLALGCSHVE